MGRMMMSLVCLDKWPQPGFIRKTFNFYLNENGRTYNIYERKNNVDSLYTFYIQILTESFL